jgi:hypothetical protein
MNRPPPFWHQTLPRVSMGFLELGAGAQSEEGGGDWVLPVVLGHVVKTMS